MPTYNYNQILTGETGQATLLFEGPFTTPYNRGDWWMITTDAFDTYDSISDPRGWICASDGTVTVPSDFITSSEEGEVGLRYMTYLGDAGGGNHYYYDKQYAFNVIGLLVNVSVSKLNSSQVPGSSPIQYTHKYKVEAVARGGGVLPYIYSWSTDTGSISNLSTKGDAGILTVTNSYPNYGGVTGDVSCHVVDSYVYTADGEVSLENLGNIPNDGTGPEFDPGYGPGNGPTGGPCKTCPPPTGSSTQECSCENAKGQPTCQGPNCPSLNGEHTEASPGTNIQRFSTYAGGGSTATSYMVAR